MDQGFVWTQYCMVLYNQNFLKPQDQSIYNTSKVEIRVYVFHYLF